MMLVKVQSNEERKEQMFPCEPEKVEILAALPGKTPHDSTQDQESTCWDSVRSPAMKGDNHG